MRTNLLDKTKPVRLLLSILLVIGMLIPEITFAQSSSKGGGACTNLAPKVKVPQLSNLRSDGDDVTLNGVECSWEEAMANLAEDNNEIVVLKDLTVTTWPNKPCVFSSDPENKKELTYAAWDENVNSNVYARLDMTAPVTFKNIKVGINQILANGFALTFDEGVECTYPYQNDFSKKQPCIRNIWAGTISTDIQETNLTIKSGTFGWVYGGSGGTGKTETTNITIEGGQIYNELYGGSYNGECTTTNITIKKGTIANVYGGGFIDRVGTANINISGGNASMVEISNLYGAGCGNWETGDHNICENTNITMSGESLQPSVTTMYGGGLMGQVTGTAKINMSGGRAGNIYGGGWNDGNNTATCQNTEITISGGRIGGDNSSKIPYVCAGGYDADVLGGAKVTISGDFKLGNIQNPAKLIVCAAGKKAACDSVEIVIAADLKDKIGSIVRNTEASGSAVTNSCKLTFKDLGTSGSAYSLPWKIEGFTTVTLDNTYLTTGDDTKCFVVDPTNPTTFKGTGFTSPVKVNTSTSTGLTAPLLLFKAEASILPEPTVFTGIGNLSDKYIFRANNTYRLTTVSSDNFKTIEYDGYTTSDREGDTLKVKIQETELISGDKIPTGTELTIQAISKNEYKTVVKDAGNGDAIVSETLTVTQDANLSMTIVPHLDLSEQNEDVTISQDDKGKWQYIAQQITRSVTPEMYKFNGVVKNTLADGKIVVIGASSEGTLTFESAVINSKSSAGAALTIESGAEVVIKGDLSVTTENSDSYALDNKGSLTIDKGTDEGGNATKTTVTVSNTVTGDKAVQVATDASLLLTGENVELQTTGISNSGTVVAKDGSEATNTTTTVDLLKTYEVTVTAPANGNSLTVKAGDIAIVTGDKVTAKTKLTVKAVAASAYQLKEVTATVASGNKTILSSDEYTMTEEPVTFAAEFTRTYIPPVYTYYTVTLPIVEGVTSTPKAGNHIVEEGYNFSFTLKLDAGYESSIPVVKANGKVVTPRESDGKYVVRNVEEDIQITIEGIVKDDPTANAVISGDANRIYAVRNILYVESNVTAEAQVVSIGGRIVRQLHIAPGINYVEGLQPGVYIVRVSDGRNEKISIR